jgi:hypothetical protein
MTVADDAHQIARHALLDVPLNVFRTHHDLDSLIACETGRKAADFAIIARCRSRRGTTRRQCRSL